MNFQFLNRPLGSESLPFGQIKRYNGAFALDYLTNNIKDIFNWAREDQQRNENFAYNNFWNQKNFDENQRQFEANMAWSKDQFAKQREFALDERRYQDPAAQVKRLRDAGINPALAFGSGSMSTPSISSVGGASGSSGSVASAPSLGSNRGFPSTLAADFASETNAHSQAKLANASSRRELAAAANLEIKNKLDEESLQHDLLGRINAARKGTVEYERAQEDLAYFRAVKGYREQLESGRLSLQSEELKQAVESTLQQKLQTKLMQLQVAFAPRLSEAQLAQYWTTVKSLSAQAAMFASQGKLNKQQIQTEIAKGANIEADTAIKQLHIDTNKIPEVKKAIVSTIVNEALELQKELESWDATWWNRTISGYVSSASGVGAAAVLRTPRIIKP